MDYENFGLNHVGQPHGVQDGANAPQHLEEHDNSIVVDFLDPFQGNDYGSDIGLGPSGDPFANTGYPDDLLASAIMSDHRERATSSSGQGRNGSVEELFVQSPGHGDSDDEFNFDGADAFDGTDLGSKTKDAETPAWTELKTKAGKERKRLPLACIACRRKKIRCSGEKPACKHCTRAHVPCVFKANTRKAAPRTDYMAMMDKRLKRMEERIIKIVSTDEQDANAVVRAQVRPQMATPATAGKKKKKIDDQCGGELDAWARSEAPDTARKVPAIKVAQEAEEGKLLREGKDALPPQEMCEHLAEVFFENVYGQAYHVLHKPSFMRKLRSGSVPPVLILAVCAVSARFSTHAQFPEHSEQTPQFLRGEDWAAEARKIVLDRFDRPNITILTCLLLLGLHEFGTCYGGRSWSYGGMAIRMAYALQLHKDLDHDPARGSEVVRLSSVDREIRRRIFWACFLMDRFNSSGMDRPMFMKETNIKAKLPVQERFFQLEMDGLTEDLKGMAIRPDDDDGSWLEAQQNLGVAAWLIRSISLWGRIVIYHSQGGRESEDVPVWSTQAQFVQLAEEADGFAGRLPESLAWSMANLNAHDTDGTANQFIFLHITIMQNILFTNYEAIHGHPGGRPPVDCPKDFISAANAKAFTAAEKLSEYIRAADAHRLTAPFAPYCAFMSSRVQMAAAFSSDPEKQALAKKNLATNVRYITKMKKCWGALHFTSETLKAQFRTWMDASTKGGDLSSTSIPPAHYADWFEIYPRGVSQADYGDPNTAIKEEKGDDAVLGQKSVTYTVEEFFNNLEPSSSQAQRPQSRPTKKSKKSEENTPAQSRAKQTKSPSAPPPQIHHGPPLQSANQAVPHDFNRMSPHDGALIPQQQMIPQDFYAPQEFLFPAAQPSFIPQMDRQLAFTGYGNASMSRLNPPLPEGGWDMNMDQMQELEVPPNQWMMPFNTPHGMMAQQGMDDSFGTTSMGLVGGAYGMDMGAVVYGTGMGLGARQDHHMSGGGAGSGSG